MPAREHANTLKKWEARLNHHPGFHRPLQHCVWTMARLDDCNTIEERAVGVQDVIVREMRSIMRCDSAVPPIGQTVPDEVSCGPKCVQTWSTTGTRSEVHRTLGLDESLFASEGRIKHGVNAFIVVFM